MKEVLTLTTKLLLICAIVAALLAGVNMVTEPIIAANNQKTFEASMAEVLPGSKSFDEIDCSAFTPSESGVKVDSVYASDSGFVVTAICSEGYGGDISVMTGITKDLEIKQVKIMSMSETPGLGAKSTEPEFLDQYKDLTKGIQVIKNSTPSGNEVEAISGATITSKAVTKAVNTALETAAFANTQKGGSAS